MQPRSSKENSRHGTCAAARRRGEAMRRSWCVTCLIAAALLLAGCSQSFPQPSQSKARSVPQPQFTAAGILPFGSDDTLAVTGQLRGLHVGGPTGIQTVTLGVPARIDGVASVVDLTFAVDSQTQILDRAKHNVPAAKRDAVIDSIDIWHASARKVANGLLLTGLRPATSSDFAAARSHPDLVANGLLMFDANGVAKLHGSVTGGVKQALDLETPVSLERR